MNKPDKDGLWYVRYGNKPFIVSMWLEDEWWTPVDQFGNYERTDSVPDEIGEYIPPQGSYSEGWRWARLMEGTDGKNPQMPLRPDPLGHYPTSPAFGFDVERNRWMVKVWGDPVVNPGAMESENECKSGGPPYDLAAEVGQPTLTYTGLLVNGDGDSTYECSACKWEGVLDEFTTSRRNRSTAKCPGCGVSCSVGGWDWMADDRTAKAEQRIEKLEMENSNLRELINVNHEGAKLAFAEIKSAIQRLADDVARDCDQCPRCRSAMSIANHCVNGNCRWPENFVEGVNE